MMQDVYDLHGIWLACHKVVEQWESELAIETGAFADEAMREAEGNRLFMRIRDSLGRSKVIRYRITDENSHQIKGTREEGKVNGETNT